MLDRSSQAIPPSHIAYTFIVMQIFSRSILLFAATNLIQYSLTSPASPIVNNNRNLTLPDKVHHNFTNLHNDHRCYEPALWKDRRAKTMDCIRAASLLPNLHDVAMFRRGLDPGNPYVLPYSETYKTCRVKIDLLYGRADRSAWFVIKMALRFDVIDTCQLTVGGERTGGQTTAGLEERIIITAENANWPEQSIASA